MADNLKNPVFKDIGHPTQEQFLKKQENFIKKKEFKNVKNGSTVQNDADRSFDGLQKEGDDK